MSAATKNGLRSALGDPSGPSVVVSSMRGPRVACFTSDTWVDFGEGEPLQSRAFGVPHIFTCVLSEVISVRPKDALFASAASTDRCSSRAAGVPHIRTVASVSVVPCVPVVFGLPPDFRMSIVVGVGHDPDAFPSVRGANGCRAEQTPFRIEPELGKVVEDVGEPESNKLGDVLQQDESGSQVSDDGCDGWPEPALIVSSTLLPGRAERLAREAGSDEIHSATPRAAVEGGEVIPDRSRIQARLRHPLHEDGRCVGVPLNVSHGSYPCHGSEGELESSVAGAEVDGR